MIFTVTNLDFSLSIFCNAQVKIFQDRQEPFSEFQQPDAAIKTSVKFRYKSFFLAYIQHNLPLVYFNKFVFKLVVA